MVKTKVIQPGAVTRSRAMQRTPVTSNLPPLNATGGVIRKKILFDAREGQSDPESDPLELFKQNFEERKRSFIEEVPIGTWSPLKIPGKVETPKTGEKTTESSVEKNSSVIKGNPEDVVSIDSESDGDKKRKKKKRGKNADGNLKTEVPTGIGKRKVVKIVETMIKTVQTMMNRTRRTMMIRKAEVIHHLHHRRVMMKVTMKVMMKVKIVIAEDVHRVMTICLIDC
jgi:hypothetical protein